MLVSILRGQNWGDLDAPLTFGIMPIDLYYPKSPLITLLHLKVHIMHMINFNLETKSVLAGLANFRASRSMVLSVCMEECLQLMLQERPTRHVKRWASWTYYCHPNTDMGSSSVQGPNWWKMRLKKAPTHPRQANICPWMSFWLFRLAAHWAKFHLHEDILKWEKKKPEVYAVWNHRKYFMQLSNFQL